MRTKNIFKTMALAMLMPTMLLTTACSSEDDALNNIANTETVANKGYALPVTVNVTRGDGATRASFDGSKLNFSAGDKLFVKSLSSHAVAGDFAGTLDYDAVSGNFSGTLTTQNEYTGTIDDLMASATAYLLPDGYESYGFFSFEGSGYDATMYYYFNKAFALTKAAAVEQFSVERALSYSSGFALAPANAIVSFTISGLTSNKEVAVSFDTNGMGVISENVTTSAEGVATFAVGVYSGRHLEDCTLTVGGNNIAMPTKTTVAGKIYNITRNAIPGALIGQFSVSDTKKVYFSKGNLRYASGTWSFFDNQYDYYSSYSADAWDKFGWSTSANNYGMSTSQTSSDYSGNFVDWGSKSDLQTALGTGWFTLTSDEWTYLFNTRTVNGGKGSGKSYTLGQSVNGKLGVVLYPDNYTGAVYSGSDWATFESAGCVFLPAAGYRNGSSVSVASTNGIYRSATPNGADNAYYVDFYSGDLNPAAKCYVRGFGCSVRLVREVE